MSHLTCSAGPARSALRRGLSPERHYLATFGAFAAFATLGGRYTGGRLTVDCRTRSLEVLRGQYAAAMNVGDVEVAAFALAAVRHAESLVEVPA